MMARMLSLLLILIVPGSAGVPAEQPSPVLRVPCRVVEVIDGDTLTVEVRWQARIRLLDCWAPEIATAKGKVAKQRMEQLANDKDAMLEVPLSPRMRLDDVLTFGRVLGHIYVGGDDISARMVADGYATSDRRP